MEYRIAYGVSNCGVLPSPEQIDYSSMFPGATFSLNLCWQVHQSDVASVEMFWSGWPPGSADIWWAVR
jgi:hypothetical protein